MIEEAKKLVAEEEAKKEEAKKLSAKDEAAEEAIRLEAEVKRRATLEGGSRPYLTPHPSPHNPHLI